jgi:hypothetical protein
MSLRWYIVNTTLVVIVKTWIKKIYLTAYSSNDNIKKQSRTFSHQMQLGSMVNTIKNIG